MSCYLSTFAKNHISESFRNHPETPNSAFHYRRLPHLTNKLVFMLFKDLKFCFRHVFVFGKKKMAVVYIINWSKLPVFPTS